MPAPSRRLLEEDLGRPHLLLLQRCASDAERLWLLDLLALSAGSCPAFIVDDVFLRSSHPAASLLQMDMLDHYACTQGVVFETGGSSKSVVAPDGLAISEIHCLKDCLRSSLQGGTPEVVSANTFLGVPHSSGDWTSAAWITKRKSKDPSILLSENEAHQVLKSVEIKAAVARQTACSNATLAPWPLLARRFYLLDALAKTSYLSPLGVAHPRAGLRFSLIQERWMQAVVYGVGLTSSCGRWPKEVRDKACADLGWKPLWRQVQSQAIVMFQRMSADGPQWSHARAAQDPDPPHGSWFWAVRHFMTKWSIPPCHILDLADHPPPKRRRLLKGYRVQQVELQLGISQGSPLPWVWLAAMVHLDFIPRGFEIWWHYRLLGTPSRKTFCLCPGCSSPGEPSATHLIVDCLFFRDLCTRHRFDGSTCLDTPTCEDTFLVILRAFAELHDTFFNG